MRLDFIGYYAKFQCCASIRSQLRMTNSINNTVSFLQNTFGRYFLYVNSQSTNHKLQGNFFILSFQWRKHRRKSYERRYNIGNNSRRWRLAAATFRVVRWRGKHVHDQHSVVGFWVRPWTALKEIKCKWGRLIKSCLVTMGNVGDDYGLSLTL